MQQQRRVQFHGSATAVSNAAKLPATATTATAGLFQRFAHGKRLVEHERHVDGAFVGELTAGDARVDGGFDDAGIFDGKTAALRIGHRLRRRKTALANVATEHLEYGGQRYELGINAICRRE